MAKSEKIIQKIKCFFGFHKIEIFWQEWQLNSFDLYPIVKCGCSLGPFKISTVHTDWYYGKMVRQRKDINNG